jgi:uncharacterized LabA/DUF88 family protein
VRAFYYTAVIEDQEFSSIRPLLDWLDYNGFTVVTKPTKEFIDANGHRKVKGNMDVELAVNAMELADLVDHIVLFSGDGNFRSLVEAVQRRGVRVTVVSTISSQPPIVADELRRQADKFTDLLELQSKLGRDPSQRTAPREENQHTAHHVRRRTSSGGGYAPRETGTRTRKVAIGPSALSASPWCIVGRTVLVIGWNGERPADYDELMLKCSRTLSKFVHGKSFRNVVAAPEGRGR